MASTTRETFKINKHDYDVIFDGHKVVWEVQSKAKGKDGTILTKEILLEDLIAVVVDSKSSPKLILHHIQHTQGKLYELKLVATCLQHTQLGACEAWEQRLTQALKEQFPQRPKRLLVFVNPKSGNSIGVKNYKKYAAPVFQTANIEVDFIETQSATHAHELLAKYDLSSIDSVVAMGGDGTVSQVANGLFLRSMADSGTDVNDPEADVTPVSIPLGVLPSGSSMFMSVATTGIKDITTSALRIVQGNTFEGSILGAYNHNRLIGYAILMVGGGVMADFCRDSESHRQYGKSRYLIYMFKHFFNPKSHKFEVDFPVSQKEDEGAVGGEVEHMEDDFYVALAMLGDVQKIADDNVHGSVLSETGLQLAMCRHWRACEVLTGGMLKSSVGTWGFLKYVKNFMGMKKREENPHQSNVISTNMKLKFLDFNKEKDCVNIDGEPVFLSDPTVTVKLYPKKIKYIGIIV